MVPFKLNNNDFYYIINFGVVRNYEKGAISMSKNKSKNNKSNSSMKFTVILTLFVIAALTFLVIYSNNNKSDANQDIAFENEVSLEGQPILGNPEAPVTVIEFGDYKCPACKNWGETIFPQLQKDYMEQGDVKFSFINVLFHGEESAIASSAAEALYKQNPEQFWEFHKVLYAAQPESNDHDSAWVTVEKMIEVASSVPSINVEQFQEDLQSDTIKEEVEKDSQLVEDFDVQFTPSIMVNNVMLEDPFDYEKIKSLIEEGLKEHENGK